MDLTTIENAEKLSAHDITEITQWMKWMISC